MKRLILIALLSPMVYASDTEQLGGLAGSGGDASTVDALEDTEMPPPLIGDPVGPFEASDDFSPALPMAAGATDDEDSDEAEEEDF